MKLRKLVKNALGITAFIGLTTVYKANALTIIPTYDSSLLNAFGTANLANLKLATGQVINQYESLFTNNVTLTIDIKAMSSGLGQSNYSGTVGNYTKISNALTLSASKISLPTSNPFSNSTFFVSKAEAKALGFSSPNATNGYDGIFSIADNVNYTFCTTSVTCSIASGTYDYNAVVEHEISEIMGRGTGITVGGKYYPSPFDLFRFTSKGVRSFNTNTSSAYFSINNGATNLKTFNNHSDGGDASDWAGGTNDAFNAFLNPGVVSTFSFTDITVMNALGWKLSSNARSLSSASSSNVVIGSVTSSAQTTPEPSMFLGLGGIMLLGLAAMMKRKK